MTNYEVTQFVRDIEAFLYITNGKLWSEGQIWPTIYFVKKAFLEHTSHPLAYVLPTAALALQRQSGCGRDHMACKVENICHLAL